MKKLIIVLALAIGLAVPASGQNRPLDIYFVGEQPFIQINLTHVGLTRSPARHMISAIRGDGSPPIAARGSSVAWGNDAHATSLPHSAIVVPEELLLDRRA